MRLRTMAPAVAALVLMLCLPAAAAEKQDAKPGVTVVYADGKTVELKALDIGVEDAGLFGSSFKKLKKLPVRTKTLLLKVSLSKLAKIEFLSVDKEGKQVRLRLTARNGKTLEGAIESEQKIVWKGVHPFADADAELDPTKIKEIILKPAKKK